VFLFLIIVVFIIEELFHWKVKKMVNLLFFIF